jgi:glycosyltransferase involved in cell wall biosynthesis
MNSTTQPDSNYPDRDKVAVIIPAYNESRFIGSVVLSACRYASTVIVVDDGSTDDTAEIAGAAGAIILHHASNTGKGTALNTGFEHARKNTGAQVIVMIDGDGQHNPAEIPLLVQPILDGRADVAIGSRFLEAKSKIPKWRQFGQHALTIATNLGSSSNFTDSQSGFRAFARSVLDVFRFDSRGFSVESEMQFMVHEVGLRVIEAPITVVYSEPAKRNPVAQGLQVINGLLRLVSQYRPLLYFGGGGMLVLTIGVLWGFYVVDRYNRVGTLAIGYALVSVLLMVIGSTAFFSGVILHTMRGLIMEIKKFIERSEGS